MTEPGYRAFIVRVRRRADAPVRLDVEDLLDGERRSLSGEEALAIAADLEASVEGRSKEPSLKEPSGLTRPDRGP
ncbi:MAG: hypothetical protein AB1736_11735 [Chloroflexota bacterium]